MAGFFEISRGTYWAWMLGLTLVLALLSWWLGIYEPPPELEDVYLPQLVDQTASPVEHTLIGQVIVLGCLQFFAANLLFWPGLWVYRRMRGDHR